MSEAISILMPFYNARSTLPACLHSIQKQTLASWELIAVDDHANDGSRECLQQYSCRDSRIRILSNPGKGLVSALNHGLQHCNSEWVARMDADDIMHPQRLAMQLAHFRSRPTLALSATRVRLFPKESIKAGYREYLHWQNQCCSSDDIAQQIYIESPFVHPSVCFRKKFVADLGGYREGGFPEDYDLWLRLFHSGQVMEKIDKVLLNWRESPCRTSRTDSRCSRDAFDRLKARYLAHDPRLLRRKDHVFIWGAGRKTRRRCRHLLARGLQPKAWVDIDPRKIGRELQGIPVIDWRDLEQHPQAFVLIFVSNHGARKKITVALNRMGKIQGEDFLALT
jgi:glycosyltransferase involved in cell wall biosynthesis